MFWLRPRAPKPQDPWELFKRVADNHGKDAATLYEEVKVSNTELETAIL